MYECGGASTRRSERLQVEAGPGSLHDNHQIGQEKLTQHITFLCYHHYILLKFQFPSTSHRHAAGTFAEDVQGL